tara:strand:+ start:719 stop:982 length:264 start_codon:yes stop_codon:yes gene_type:complete
METWEEKIELAPGKYQILNCTKDAKGRVEKLDSGFKEIDGQKIEKENPALVVPTKLADIPDLNNLRPIDTNLIMKKVAEDLIGKGVA